jgi:hypothetical protein
MPKTKRSTRGRKSSHKNSSGLRKLFNQRGALRLSSSLPFLNSRVIAVMAGVVVIGVSLVAFSQAAAASPEIKSGVGTKCLDDFHSGTTNGNKVDIYDCNGTNAQQWELESNGSVKVMGKCLDVYQQSKTNGSKVDLYTCNGGRNQQWTYSSSSHQLTSVQSGKCLSDTDASMVNGTALQIWSCNSNVQQTWYFMSYSKPGTTQTPMPAPVSTPSSSATPQPTRTSTPTPSHTPTPTPVSSGSVPTAFQTATSSCSPTSQTITVSGEQWVRTNNNWGGSNVCLNTWDGKTVSELIDSQNAAPKGGVMGYPDLSQGWNYGGGSVTGGWTSKQISALSNPSVTWITSHANAVSGSKYDTGADLWFATDPNFTNKAAEVFIALNDQGEPPSTNKEITIDGASYYFYIVPQSGWNEIIFAAANQVSSVNNLALLPFFQYCVSQNLMTNSDYWVNAGFGNEIWQLGTGLQTEGISLQE